MGKSKPTKPWESSYVPKNTNSKVTRSKIKNHRILSDKEVTIEIRWLLEPGESFWEVPKCIKQYIREKKLKKVNHRDWHDTESIYLTLRFATAQDACFFKLAWSEHVVEKSKIPFAF